MGTLTKNYDEMAAKVQFLNNAAVFSDTSSELWQEQVKKLLYEIDEYFESGHEIADTLLQVKPNEPKTAPEKLAKMSLTTLTKMMVDLNQTVGELNEIIVDKEDQIRKLWKRKPRLEEMEQWLEQGAEYEFKPALRTTPIRTRYLEDTLASIESELKYYKEKLEELKEHAGMRPTAVAESHLNKISDLEARRGRIKLVLALREAIK